MTGGNLLALPQWLSRYIVFIGTASLAGLTGYYVYQRFQGNPMRFHRDADGVWRPMTRKEHIEQRLAKVQEKLEGDPENKAAQIHMKLLLKALENENKRLVEEGGGVGAVTTSGASEEDELR